VAIGILAALEYRRRTGRGQYIDISQVECSIDFMAPLILNYSASAELIKPIANRDPHAAPHGAYRCRGEDSWCVIAVTNDEEWRVFCQVLDQPDWIDDPRFALLQERKSNEDQLDNLVGQWTINHEAEEIVQWMQAKGVPAGVVQSSKDLNSDPQLAHRGHFKRLKHPEMGMHNYETFGFRLSTTPGGPQGPAPCLGEHTNYVCSQILNLSDEELVELLNEGVLE
jgi:benzylsuccinate CoA-transferase BbsF subunit